MITVASNSTTGGAWKTTVGTGAGMRALSEVGHGVVQVKESQSLHWATHEGDQSAMDDRCQRTR